MKIASREIENRQVLLDIEVDDQRLEKAMDQAYRRVVGRLNVPGFRKGKAPRALVERMLGREALVEDAIEHLIPEVYREAITTEGIRPAANPKLEVVSSTPLQFTATVPLEPSVELGTYREVRVTPEPTDVSEQEVDEVMQQLREAHAEWTPVERPVQLGDRVGLDVEARVGDRAIIDSKDAEYVVDPQRPEPAPGFSHQIVGMESGQQLGFTLTLPADLSDDALAGQEAHFQVAIHGVKERQLPELDEAFASTVGSFETVEDLRKGLVDDLKRRKEETGRQRVENEVIEAVVAGSTVEVPPQVVEEEAGHLREQLARNLDSRGMTVEQYLRLTKKTEAEFRTELVAEAENHVRRSAVLRAVADADGTEASDAEVEEELRRILGEAPDAQRAVRNSLARPETRERVRSVLRERKAVRHLVALATEAELEPAQTGQGGGETHEQAD